MSTAMNTSIELAIKKLDDVTECPICSEIYNDPRSLPCVHTFCRECIEKYIEDKQPGTRVACPVCRTGFVIPECGASGLPKNFFMDKLLQLKELSRLQGGCTPCELCSPEEADLEKLKQASVYCLDCRQKLCSACAGIHKRSNVSRDHKQTSLTDPQTVDELTAKSAPTACDKHVDEQLKIYCLECGVAVCMICYVKMHNAHKCSDFHELTDEFRRQMEGDISSLADGYKTYCKMLTDLQEDQMHFTEQLEKVELEICNKTEQLKLDADLHKEKLLSQLSSLRQNRQKQLENLREDIDLGLVSLDGLKRYIEELLKKGAPSDVAREVRVLHNRANELTKHDTIGKPLYKFGVIHVTFTPANKSFCSDNIIGEITSKVTERDSKPSVPKLAHMIPATRPQITGLTSLGDRLFAVRNGTQQIEEYDAQTFALLRNLPVNGSCLFGLTSCITYNCLYVADYVANKVHKVALSGNDNIANWSVASCPLGLSVNEANDLLVACYHAHRVQVYSTYGSMVREIVLSSSLPDPLHAVQLNNGRLIVSCGSLWSQFFIAAVDQNNGNIVSCYGDSDGSSPGKLIRGSSEVVMDSSENILAVDWQLNRVMVLNSDLCWSRDLSLAMDGELDEPYALRFDESRRRLYIGENSGRIVVFDNVFNIAATAK